MEIVILGILFTVSILLTIGMIFIGREIHKMRVLLEQSTRGITQYLEAVLLEDEPKEMKASEWAVSEKESSLTNEEKKMLWNFDPEQLLTEVIGDIL